MLSVILFSPMGWPPPHWGYGWELSDSDAVWHSSSAVTEGLEIVQQMVFHLICHQYNWPLTADHHRLCDVNGQVAGCAQHHVSRVLTSRVRRCGGAPSGKFLPSALIAFFLGLSVPAPQHCMAHPMPGNKSWAWSSSSFGPPWAEFLLRAQLNVRAARHKGRRGYVKACEYAGTS